MNHPGFLKSLLTGIVFLAAPLAFADGGHPAVFREMREPTPEELAEGAPLAVIVRQIKAIRKDAEVSQGKVLQKKAPTPPTPSRGKKSKAQEEKEEAKLKEEATKLAAEVAADKALTDAIYASMTPAMKNTVNQTSHIRKLPYYIELKSVEIEKPFRFNVIASDSNHLAVNIQFPSSSAGRINRTVYFKKFDTYWLQCIPDEFPGETLKKLGLKRHKQKTRKADEE